MLTSNTDYTHGLAAGVRAGARGGSVLFSDRDSLGHSAKSTIARHAGAISRIVLMGGTSSLGAGVESDLDMTEPPSGSITGTVTTEGGETPLPNVEVVAYGFDPQSTDFPLYRAHAATTAADGSYTIDHLEPGRYWLTFTDSAGAHSAESYPDAPPDPGHGDLVWVDASPVAATSVDESMITTAAWAAQRVVRLSGADRYSTAIAISAASHRHADTAVIVTGEGFADALSASALAGAYRAPLLLTRTGSLPSGLTAELRRLGVRRLLIVGGDGAVMPSVRAELAKRGFDVSAPIAGRDRYETSALVYRYLRTASDLPTVAPEPFIARGDTFPDALAAAPFAFRQIRPILLVRPTSAPASVKSLFSEFRIVSVIVVGGTGAVRDSVLADLWPTGQEGGLAVTRLQGRDRYVTASRVARHWPRPYHFAGLASGENYPDALVGSVLSGARGGALLLTPKDTLAASAHDVLDDNAESLAQVRVFGGTAAVSSGTMEQVRSACAIGRP